MANPLIPLSKSPETKRLEEQLRYRKEEAGLWSRFRKSAFIDNAPPTPEQIEKMLSARLAQIAKQSGKVPTEQDRINERVALMQVLTAKEKSDTANRKARLLGGALTTTKGSLPDPKAQGAIARGQEWFRTRQRIYEMVLEHPDVPYEDKLFIIRGTPEDLESVSPETQKLIDHYEEPQDGVSPAWQSALSIAWNGATVWPRFTFGTIARGLSTVHEASYAIPVAQIRGQPIANSKYTGSTFAGRTIHPRDPSRIADDDPNFVPRPPPELPEDQQIPGTARPTTGVQKLRAVWEAIKNPFEHENSITRLLMDARNALQEEAYRESEKAFNERNPHEERKPVSYKDFKTVEEYEAYLKEANRTEEMSAVARENYIQNGAKKRFEALVQREVHPVLMAKYGPLLADALAWDPTALVAAGAIRGAGVGARAVKTGVNTLAKRPDRIGRAAKGVVQTARSAKLLGGDALEAAAGILPLVGDRYPKLAAYKFMGGRYAERLRYIQDRSEVLALEDVSKRLEAADAVLKSQPIKGSVDVQLGPSSSVARKDIEELTKLRAKFGDRQGTRIWIDQKLAYESKRLAKEQFDKLVREETHKIPEAGDPAPEFHVVPQASAEERLAESVAGPQATRAEQQSVFTLEIEDIRKRSKNTPTDSRAPDSVYIGDRAAGVVQAIKEGRLSGKEAVKVILDKANKRTTKYVKEGKTNAPVILTKEELTAISSEAGKVAQETKYGRTIDLNTELTEAARNEMFERLEKQGFHIPRTPKGPHDTPMLIDLPMPDGTRMLVAAPRQLAEIRMSYARGMMEAEETVNKILATGRIPYESSTILGAWAQVARRAGSPERLISGGMAYDLGMATLQTARLAMIPWKIGHTIMRPGFQAMNDMSVFGFLYGSRSGAKGTFETIESAPRAVTALLLTYAEHGPNWVKKMGKKFGNITTTLPDGQTVTLNKLSQILREAGIIDPSLYRLGLDVSKSGKFTQMASALLPSGPFPGGGLHAKFTDDAQRAWAFTSALRGTTPQQIAEAKAFADKYVGSYRNLNRIERGVMRDIAPFYTFSKIAIHNNIHMIMNNPDKYAKLVRMRLGAHKIHVNESGAVEPDSVPKHLRPMMPIMGPQQLDKIRNTKVSIDNPEFVQMVYDDPISAASVGYALIKAVSSGFTEWDDETLNRMAGPLATIAWTIIAQRDPDSGEIIQGGTSEILKSVGRQINPVGQLGADMGNLVDLYSTVDWEGAAAMAQRYAVGNAYGFTTRAMATVLSKTQLDKLLFNKDIPEENLSKDRSIHYGPTRQYPVNIPQTLGRERREENEDAADLRQQIYRQRN